MLTHPHPLHNDTLRGPAAIIMTTIHALIAVLILVAPPSLTSQAQELPTTRTISPEELSADRFKRDDVKQRRETLNASVVRVKATPKLSPHIRPITDPAAYGHATLVHAADDQVTFVTAEFLVRNAARIELIHDDELHVTQVLHADSSQGLAMLVVPQALANKLTPLEIVPQTDLGARLFTLDHTPEGHTLVHPVTIGAPGQKELAWYQTATPALINGAPMVTDDNRLYGLYTFRPVQMPGVGLAITGEKLLKFLHTPEDSDTSPETIELDVKGSTTRHLRR